MKHYTPRGLYRGKRRITPLRYRRGDNTMLSPDRSSDVSKGSDELDAFQAYLPCLEPIRIFTVSGANHNRIRQPASTRPDRRFTSVNALSPFPYQLLYNTGGPFSRRRLYRWPTRLTILMPVSRFRDTKVYASALCLERPPTERAHHYKIRGTTNGSFSFVPSSLG